MWLVNYTKSTDGLVRRRPRPLEPNHDVVQRAEIMYQAADEVLILLTIGGNSAPIEDDLAFFVIDTIHKFYNRLICMIDIT